MRYESDNRFYTDDNRRCDIDVDSSDPECFHVSVSIDGEDGHFSPDSNDLTITRNYLHDLLRGASKIPSPIQNQLILAIQDEGLYWSLDAGYSYWTYTIRNVYPA